MENENYPLGFEDLWRQMGESGWTCAAQGDATVIGLLVSLLQALTQIQEQTLGFAVKLVAITITIMAASSWMGGEIMLYTQEIFKNFAFLAR